MDNRFSRWEKSIIGATLIGLIPLGAIAQFPSLGLAQELKKSEQLIKEIQSKQSKLMLAQNAEKQNRTQLSEKARPFIVTVSTELGYGNKLIVNPDQAGNLYTQATPVNSKQADAYNNRGLVRYAVKNYLGAEADYTQAIKLNPDYANAYYNRGLVRYAVKDYSGAEADFTQAIKLNPNEADAYYNRNLLRRQ